MTMDFKKDLLLRIQIAVDEPTITFDQRNQLMDLYKEINSAEVITPEHVAKVNAMTA